MGLKFENFQRRRPLPMEIVPVPEWAQEGATPDEIAACTVTVRALSGTQRDAFEASLLIGKDGKKQTDMANVRAKLVAACLIPEPGDLPWPVEELGRSHAAALARVFEVCQRLSGLSPADVKELAGNSEPGPTDSSPSTSA